MKTILVLTDFSTKAKNAAKIALEIAVKVDAEVLLYHTFYFPPELPSETGIYPYHEVYTSIEKENMIKLNELATELKAKTQQIPGYEQTVIRFKAGSGNLSDNLAVLNKKKKIWMIVMGEKSKVGELSRFIFGSSISEVIDKGIAPVLLIPEKTKELFFKQIACATELNSAERKGIRYIQKIAKIWNSKVVFTHVHQDTLSLDEKLTHYNNFKKLVSGIDFSELNYLDLNGDEIKPTLSRYVSKEQVDLMVLFHKKRSFIGQLLHNSVSKEMSNYHRVPLLILNQMEKT